jgi:hypothetical protein
VPFPVNIVWSAFPFGNVEGLSQVPEDYEQMEPRLLRA